MKQPLLSTSDHLRTCTSNVRNNRRRLAAFYRSRKASQQELPLSTAFYSPRVPFLPGNQNGTRFERFALRS